MVIRDPRARGVYAISVAAELVGTGQQNLRLYDRKGLLEPWRTDGGTRRYSENDLVTLRRIAELLAQGLNLSGIRLVLALETENTALKDKLTRHPDRTGTQRHTQAATNPDTRHPQQT
ncbi:MerR family transcriptional regulator [Arthrobacter sp. LAPM80]|uniref:MerR family transcriptional regulator n=1 Tax=Arthrobacter sp. LAPM80 TaxID=3141788 RepID=UPI00398AFFA6